MITKATLTNFKCFKSPTTFEFSKINLLTGINGRGKSTLLQSLLVLAQTGRKYPTLDSLVVTGDLVKLGNFEDIKNSDTARANAIVFHLETNEEKIENAHIEYHEAESDPYSALLTNLSIKSNNNTTTYDLEDIEIFKSNYSNDNLLKNLNSLLSNIHYVSADRLGPVKYVEKLPSFEFHNVGPKGEFTIHVLSNDNLPLVNELLYRGVDARTVKQQTEEWLSYILEGANIEIKGKENSSSVLYMLLNNTSSPSGYKPINIGFGYSYVLPLIVTGLIAKSGDIVIIENPEAHLHPRAQSKIAEFFSRVASCGVQVFIESHSEHILNGLRVSSLDIGIDIQPACISIHYFNEKFLTERLSMDKKAKVENWPEGFFDQQEIDLATLFKQGREI